MNKLKKHIRHLIFGYLVSALVSCDASLDRYGEECDYTVQLTYHYNEENTAATNRLTSVVFTMNEYIFDEAGVLYAINPLRLDECTGQWVSQLDLPPGRYSVMTWGNLGETCSLNDARIGTTTRDEMVLTMDNPCTEYPGYQNNNDRIYYGYRTFSVEPGKLTDKRVDMMHSHLSLRIRVRWKRNAPTVGEYQLRLTQIPSEYAWMPEFLSDADGCRKYDCDVDDTYHTTDWSVKHHIPTVWQDRNIVDHRLNSRMNDYRHVEGEFLTFRIRRATDLALSLHRVDETRAEAVQVMKNIALKPIFEQWNFDLDQTLKQEYALDFLIDDGSDGGTGTVTISLIDILDWSEGGPLN